MHFIFLYVVILWTIFLEWSLFRSNKPLFIINQLIIFSKKYVFMDFWEKIVCVQQSFGFFFNFHFFLNKKYF